MSWSLKRSNAHCQRAVQRLALDVSSNIQYWGEEQTIYIERGRGGRVWDIDGNEYGDYRLAYGASVVR
jgi:glutamate-1-semialdehyde 2,1-aminomutase